MQKPIGVFDSGVGGLSVLRSIRDRLPREAVIYFGDQAHIPYGPRPLDEVRAFSEEITRFLLGAGAKLIVVACNAASAAALHSLRRDFAQVLFVGMEPAVKPAAETTKTGRVGVLATPATFQGALYASVVERFAGNVTLLQSTCPGLVQHIEAGKLASAETRRILEAALLPMLEQGIDTVVLGCTHYPFIIPLIQEIVGADVRVIDPAPAVAKQVERLLQAGNLLAEGDSAPPVASRYEFYTSGDPKAFQKVLRVMFGETGPVTRVGWRGNRITRPAARGR